MIRTGVQQLMLGSVVKNEKSAAEALRVIKNAGYDGIELNGFMIRPTPFLVRALTKAAGMPAGNGGKLDWKALVKDAGLSVISVHEDLGSIKRDPQAVIREAAEFGTSFVVITGMYRFDMGDESAMAGLCQDLNEYGKILSEGGVRLLYHNHNTELQRVGKHRSGTYGADTAMQYLLDHTDPAFVNFEFDSYWFTDGGADAAWWMEHLGSRLKLWHINDRGSRQSGPAMTPILKTDCCELGYGNMNLDRLACIAGEIGVEGVILETHRNFAERSPLRSIELSAPYLRETFGKEAK